jgi:hypothetical protein
VAKRRNSSPIAHGGRTPLPCPKCGKDLRAHPDPEHQRVTLTCRPKCRYRQPIRYENFFDDTGPRPDLQLG